MKLVIVDDELSVCEAIRLLINQGNFTHIFEATDYNQATQIIEHHKPEIIIVDLMMLGQDGPAFLKWIYEHAPTSKTIVLSGHHPFSLVQQAIHYGVTDYLIKPTNPETIQASLLHAIASWDKEDELRLAHHRRNAELNEMRSMNEDKVLSHFILPKPPVPPNTDVLVSQFGMPLSLTHAQIALLTGEQMNKHLLKQFSQNHDLLLFSLQNLCSEYLQISHSGVAFRHWQHDQEIILLMWKKRSGVYEILHKIQEYCLQRFQSHVEIGLGEAHLFPYHLYLSYQEARQALLHRNLIQRTSWIHSITPDQYPSALRTSFKTCGERLKLIMQSGQRKSIESILTEWLTQATHEAVIHREHIEQWWMTFNVWRVNWIQENLPTSSEQLHGQTLDIRDGPLYVPLDEQGLLDIPAWKEHILNLLMELSSRLLVAQHQDNKVIYEIAKYVEKNYREDISLQDTARHFFMSREYISRKFKQEFKVTFTEYLSRLRIEKSKILLLNPYLRIAQVAEQVGYPDEKYFSKVFKKITGLSPKDYREQNK